MQSSARDVIAAISVTESDEVLLARIAPGLANLSKSVKISSLSFHFLWDSFDQQIGFATDFFGRASR